MVSFISKVAKHIEVQRLLQKGQKIGRHIVVFESDDWGSIRMPSVQARTRLLNKGVVLQSPLSYDLYDTLASEDDLSDLAEVLDSVRDSDDNPAVLTLDTVVANPDFERIKESGFSEYYYEPFSVTLGRYPHHEKSFALWKEGMSKGVFHPQFHAREHLNAQLWLQCLRNHDPSALAAFDEGVFSMRCMVDNKLQRVLETYNARADADYPFMLNAIKEGLDLFERLFGFRSESMIAPCYTWDSPIEEEAACNGVLYLQGSVFQSHSYYYSIGHPHQDARYMGTRNSNGQISLVRNCSFEPSQSRKHGKDRCLRDISLQFSNGLPAIVSCHRVNFIGDLVPENRHNNLRQFRELLHTIVRRWPDVKFVSSDQLGRILSEYEAQ